MLYGDDEFTQVAKRGVAVDFYKKMMLVETDEHILWPYHKALGYGKVYINGKMKAVHRLALAYHTAEPSKHMDALHKPILCSTKACFNYRHLYWGDDKDNARDRHIEGVTARGAQVGVSKLQEEDVLAIVKDSRTRRAIAADYGVSHQNITDIKLGKTWGWLTQGKVAV